MGCNFIQYPDLSQIHYVVNNKIKFILHLCNKTTRNEDPDADRGGNAVAVSNIYVTQNVTHSRRKGVMCNIVDESHSQIIKYRRYVFPGSSNTDASGW